MKKVEIAEFIVDWLGDYLHENHLKGYVIGISGGVDSAVVSTLCAQTGFPLLCLEMPIHQERNQAGRAHQHILWLKENYPNVEHLEIDLTATFNQMAEAFPQTENQDAIDLALANTRARLRMTTLYYFAGVRGLVVVGTGNKIEDFGIGFFTKYGDGGVDISPIADLYKTEVYELAEFLGINKEILKAKPTDGLFGDDRSDEDQIGATYPELEWAMKQMDSGKTEEGFSGRELEVFKIYSHRHRVNKHKWKPIPVCIIPEELKR